MPIPGNPTRPSPQPRPLPPPGTPGGPNRSPPAQPTSFSGAFDRVSAYIPRMQTRKRSVLDWTIIGVILVVFGLLGVLLVFALVP